DCDQQVINIVATEVGVTVGGDYFEDAVVQLQNGNIEGATAEVVNGDNPVFLLIQAVGKRRRSGFVHKSENLEPGDASGVLGRLALRVVEVCRHGDDGFRYGSAEVPLGVGLELNQD